MTDKTKRSLTGWVADMLLIALAILIGLAALNVSTAAPAKAEGFEHLEEGCTPTGYSMDDFVFAHTYLGGEVVWAEESALEALGAMILTSGEVPSRAALLIGLADGRDAWSLEVGGCMLNPYWVGEKPPVSGTGPSGSIGA